MSTYQMVATIKHEEGAWSHLSIDFKYQRHVAEVFDYKALTVVNVKRVGANHLLSFEALPTMEQVQIRRAIGLFLEYERIASTFNDETQHFECLTN